MIKKLFIRIHILQSRDQAILTQFLCLAQVDPLHDHEDLILAKLYSAFAHIPYENLTKIIKADAVISSDSAERLPDEVLRDYLHVGAGSPVFIDSRLCCHFAAVGVEAASDSGRPPLWRGYPLRAGFFPANEIFLLDPGF